VTNLRDEAGFSLLELLVATGVLLVVSSIVTDALMQMTTSQKTIWNRTEMHSGIRGATELLQQEVGQAGRVSLPAPVAVGAGGITIFSSPCTTPSTVTLSPSTSGIFPGEILTILDGDTQESVAVTAIPSSTAITACFTRPHGVGASILPLGGFATGIVPNTGIANPSTATVLKMYGDINGDGRMVYVEYVCDTAARKLYRHASATSFRIPATRRALPTRRRPSTYKARRTRSCSTSRLPSLSRPSRSIRSPGRSRRKPKPC